MGRVSSDWLCTEPGAKDFGAAYLDHFDSVYDESSPILESHPKVGVALRARTPEQRTASRVLARERLEEALAGHWDDYAEALRYDGSSYAIRGLEFGIWQAFAVVQSRLLIPVLIDRLASEPRRLDAAIQTLNKFCQLTMSEIGEAYVQQSEGALRTWQTLFQQLPSGICVLEPDTLVVRYANLAFREMYGLTDADMGVRKWDSLFDPEDLERVRRNHTQVAYATGKISYEALHLRDDGTPFPVLVDGVQIPSPRPDTLNWGISVRDLTERQQMEALRSHSVELEMENRRVQEGSRLKSEFLANMSHELRTPLNSILGFSELLVQGEVGELSAQQRDFVGDIYTSGKHLLRLINDVLDLSKVEAGKMEFHPEPIDLGALVQEVTGVLRGVADSRSIRLAVRIDDAVRNVHLDPSRLKQVLYNYLSNAIKFSAQGASIEVHATPEGESSLRLEVVDHGAGIAEVDLSRLFVEFEQLDRGRGKNHGGTGLGLALTRRLVEAQGGEVGVRSKVGEGSTFFALLPRHLVGTVSLPLPRHIPSAHAAAPRVLVIEDDATDQERIVRVLLDAGYAVDTAATGAQALRAVEQHRYDALTLDLLLPDSNGLAILQALRRRPGMETVPVIVISVVSDQVTGGFVVNDALQKPLQPDELLNALRRANVVPPTTGPVLVVDDDESSTRLITASLSQMGFRVQVAHDGRQALERARAERPAAVILDLVMPNLDGFGFLQEFRKEPAFCMVPVLIWTVKDLSSEEQRQLLQSAAAVLPKDGSGLRNIVDILKRHVPAPRGEQ